MKNLVIIGAGAAGYTAAIYSARANLHPIIIAGDLPGGQLTQTTDVENYPGFSQGILGFNLMEEMRQQAERFGTTLIRESVVSLEKNNNSGYQLSLKNGDNIQTKAVIIATGAAPRWLGLESEEKLKNKGVSSCATCDGAFFSGFPICVVGGGDSAMEEALFLTKFATKVIIIHRRDKFRASKIMTDRVLKHPKIEISWNSIPLEIQDINQDKVTGILLQDTKTRVTKTIECGAVFVAIGHIPSTTPFRSIVQMDEDGYIITSDNNTQTNKEGIFAAGDCVDRIYRQAITAAGMGCQAAIDAERWLESQE